jgi:carbonic anhydrase/acetyltransferase-like protein (isoleucine patch superfamily)
MVHRIGDKVPDVDKALFVAWNAEVAGSVTLAEETSVWFSATLRGDIEPITVGRGSNVQDGATLHVDFDLPCVVGERVTIGHQAILHGCTVGDDCLIGMGAVVLSGAVIGKESVVGAGALVTEGKSFPPRSLIIGSPAKAVRTLDDAALEKVRENGRIYVRLAAEADRSYREVPGPEGSGPEEPGPEESGPPSSNSG